MDDVISKIYYDKSGFGGIKTTFEDARKIDKSITLDKVKEWFKQNVEQKKQLKGYNSFVAPSAYYEYQFDLFFINDLDNQNYKIGILLVNFYSCFYLLILNYFQACSIFLLKTDIKIKYFQTYL